VEGFGRAKPDRLQFLRIDFDRSERDLSRQNFAQAIRRLSANTSFPTKRSDSVTAAYLEHRNPRFACDLCLLDGVYCSCIPKGHSS
jgi:hypothetical protein